MTYIQKYNRQFQEHYDHQRGLEEAYRWLAENEDENTELHTIEILD